MPPKVIVPRHVEDFLRGEGLFGRVEEIVRQSARVTHPNGNRRYHHYVLNVSETGKSTVLCDVTDTRKLGGTGGPEEFVAFEDHEACGGKGCGDCDLGTIQVLRRMGPGK